METNKKISILLTIVIILLIIVPTMIKVNNNHLAKLLKVETLKIKESAFTCYLKKDCKNNQIFITELIEKKYLIRGIDPRTDEYFSDNVYVLINNSQPFLYIDNKMIE